MTTITINITIKQGQPAQKVNISQNLYDLFKECFTSNTDTNHYYSVESGLETLLKGNLKPQQIIGFMKDFKHISNADANALRNALNFKKSFVPHGTFEYEAYELLLEMLNNRNK